MTIGRKLAMAIAMAALLTMMASAADADEIGTCTHRYQAVGFLDRKDEGTLYRLYCAMFKRVPEEDGWDYWYYELLAGKIATIDIAEIFASSTEVQTRYGDLTNEEYVARVYQNVLGRSYDQAGYDYWLSELNSGNLGRGYLLLLFSESTEFVNRTQTAAGFEPVAKFGAPFEVSEDWTITVSVTPDDIAIPDNPKPGVTYAGYRVRISATYKGEGEDRPFIRPRFRGNDGIIYESLRSSVDYDRDYSHWDRARETVISGGTSTYDWPLAVPRSAVPGGVFDVDPPARAPTVILS